MQEYCPKYYDENPDYFRRLAMGLRFKNEQLPAPEPPVAMTFRPNTRPEDYFAIVDVYRMVEKDNGTRREALGSSLVSVQLVHRKVC
jgi:hypothetical protein